DTERMAWIGHSTGGETPVRAYTRLRNGENSSPYFGWEDIRVISSICPVAWFSADVVNPYDVNYHQFLGGADTDASGFAGDGYYQPLTIFERATGNRQLTYIHGAGHEVFHGFDSSDTWPDSLAQGPDLVSKAQVHKVVKAYFLALCDLYVKENQGARELFTRPYEDFHPYGIDPVMTITNEFRDALFAPRLVIDDFQTSFQPETASSGASVSMTVSEYYEVLMQDTDGSFSYDPGQPSNGMTRARFDDDPRCAVFAWSNAASLEYAPAFADQDFSSWDFLSFRACQLTRHPENDLLDGDIEFTVQLTDGNGNTSQLALSEYGKIKQTYQRDEGGELHLCLPDGVYEVIVGGTAFPSETFFEIPGYISYSTTGVYEFTIADGDSCTNVDIYMYDEYGDGWDDGELILLDENADTIAVGSLLGGLGPEPGEGWQNEFITVRIPLQEFLLNGTNLDLSDITMLSFLFGGTNGSQRGAIGLDDIELVQNNLIVSSVPATPDNILSGMRIYPNPSTSWIRFDFPTDRKVVSTEICDITGKVVATFQGLPNHWQIPSTWQSGVYIVRCTGDSFVVATRFIYAP
ncbi:MAG: T9SS type A sorting domain-containing protein, partial [Flavobacteriales bacterium]|nr:T9SS type A sorting domain-containing protein [Flavobacteriales bacterium]